MKLRGDALTQACGTETKVLNDSLTFDTGNYYCDYLTQFLCVWAPVKAVYHDVSWQQHQSFRTSKSGSDDALTCNKRTARCAAECVGVSRTSTSGSLHVDEWNPLTMQQGFPYPECVSVCPCVYLTSLHSLCWLKQEGHPWGPLPSILSPYRGAMPWLHHTQVHRCYFDPKHHMWTWRIYRYTIASTVPTTTTTTTHHECAPSRGA